MKCHYHQMLVSSELGGAGLTALHLARHVRERGGNCEVWIPGAGQAWSEATRLGLRCHAFDASSSLRHPKIPAALANWKLGRRLRKWGRGIIHVHSPLYFGAMRWGLELSRLIRVVHVQIEETVEQLRWAFRFPPDLVVTCAEFLVDLARQALPVEAQKRTRVVAVPNAVDTERFLPGPKAEARERLGVPAGRPLVLMLANLASHKGQLTAIRAVAHLKNRGVDVTCWLAGVERGGAGAYTQQLRSLIAEAGVQDRVELLGQRNDAPDLLRAADLMLLPSTHEGLPLAILEAQATRVPVLAAPTAGVPEVLEDGKTGFLIPADDAEGYSHRIQQLLENPVLYGQISESAYLRTTRAYNWSAFCARMAELYQELSESTARKRRPWELLFG